MEHRTIIGKRLSAESKRRGLKVKSLARISCLSENVVRDYISGVRSMVFDEMRRICDALGVNLFLFLSNEYAVPRLQFRNLDEKNKEIVQRIENSLQLLRPFLPPPTAPTVSYSATKSTDRMQLVRKASELANAVREAYGSKIEDIYTTLNLPVLPVSVGTFDGFLFSVGDKYVCCVNGAQKSETRLHNSLVHELGHFFFDRDANTHVNEGFFSSNKEIRSEETREFIATKFSQFYLIPFDRADRWAQQWPNIDTADVSKALRDGRASIDVAEFALGDLLQIHGRDIELSDIKEKLSDVKRSPAPGIYKFLDLQLKTIESILDEHRNEISPEVIEIIEEGLLSWKKQDQKRSSTRPL